MKTLNKILAIVFIMFLINFGCESCSSIAVKPFPEYKGVDPRVQSIVKEYKELAKIQGIVFKNEVTIGFKKINDGNTIGICTEDLRFHEIDIDESWWDRSTQISHETLLKHELDHCYCKREHDWAKDRYYPESAEEIFEQMMNSLRKGKTPPGWYDDGCPTSIMSPIILDDKCIIVHHSQYDIEMFERCDPY